MNPHRLLADPCHPLAEVDLQLPSWWRLEARRRQRLRRELASRVAPRTLDGAQADGDAQLDKELLATHVGVAGVGAEPIGEPRLMSRQRPPPLGRAVRHP